MSTAYPGPAGGHNNHGTAPADGQTLPENQQHQAYAPNGAPMYENGAPQASANERNTIGIIGLVCAILGVIFSCIPGFLIIGWILLPAAFILGLVGLFPKGKKKGSAIAAVIVSIVGTIVAALVFVFVVGNAFDEAFNEETTVTNNGDASNAVSNGSAEGDNQEPLDAGGVTRENPLPLGTTISSDEWDVTVNSIDLNATDALMAENPFNEAPAAGQVYVMANVTAKYKGDDPQGSTPFVSIAFVTPQGNEVNAYDTIAVAPEEFDNLSTLYKDASTTGNIPFLVDEASASEGVLAVEPDVFSQKRFVSVK